MLIYCKFPTNAQDFVLIKNKQTNQSKGFGFVTYREQATVDECLAKKPHNINGKEVSGYLCK